MTRLFAILWAHWCGSSAFLTSQSNRMGPGLLLCSPLRGWRSFFSAAMLATTANANYPIDFSFSITRCPSNSFLHADNDAQGLKLSSTKCNDGSSLWMLLCHISQQADTYEQHRILLKWNLLLKLMEENVFVFSLSPDLEKSVGGHVPNRAGIAPCSPWRATESDLEHWSRCCSVACASVWSRAKWQRLNWTAEFHQKKQKNKSSAMLWINVKTRHNLQPLSVPQLHETTVSIMSIKCTVH